MELFSALDHVSVVYRSFCQHYFIRSSDSMQDSENECII